MKCTTSGCNGVHLAKGFCSKCYYRVKRGGTPELSKRQRQALRRCDSPGCMKPHAAEGLCQTHYMQQKRVNNPELQVKEVMRLKAWKKRNPKNDAKLQSEYRQRNKKRLADYHKRWRTINRKAFNAYQATRKKRVKKATPKWADLDRIRDFYFRCQSGYHVDHIIPINGKTVSGLHVFSNLQYLPALKNLCKSNKFA